MALYNSKENPPTGNKYQSMLLPDGKVAVIENGRIIRKLDMLNKEHQMEYATYFGSNKPASSNQNVSPSNNPKVAQTQSSTGPSKPNSSKANTKPSLFTPIEVSKEEIDLADRKTLTNLLEDESTFGLQSSIRDKKRYDDITEQLNTPYKPVEEPKKKVITDPFKAINTAAGVLGMARGAESLFREISRKDVTDIPAPQLETPVPQDYVTPAIEGARRQADRQLQTNLRYAKELGVSPTETMGLYASGLQMNNELAAKEMEARLQQAAQYGQMESQVANQQAAMDYQNRVMNVERRDKLAAAREKAIDDSFNMITQSGLGMVQANLQKDQYDLGKKMSLYQMYGDQYNTILEGIKDLPQGTQTDVINMQAKPIQENQKALAEELRKIMGSNSTMRGLSGINFPYLKNMFLKPR